jgi:hypothetical protein
MAQLDPNPYPMPDLFAGDWREGFKRQEEALDRLMDASANLPAGKVVGGLLRWQRADGYAFYLVTKERPLTLQHVPFCDAYQVEPYLIRGLNKQDVLDQLESARRLHAIFGRSKNPMRTD